jgi:hypothetical protein
MLSMSIYIRHIIGRRHKFHENLKLYLVVVETSCPDLKCCTNLVSTPDTVELRSRTRNPS